MTLQQATDIISLQRRLGSFVPTYPPDILTYLVNVSTLNGNVIKKVVDALVVFDDYVRVNNLRQYIHLLSIMCTENINGAFVPLYYPVGYPGVIVTALGSYVYTRTGGLVGNTASWINTQIPFNAVNSINQGMMAIQALNTAVDSGGEMGVSISGVSNNLQSRFTDGNSYARHLGATVTVANASATGFYVALRSTSTDLRLYKDGTQSGSTSTTLATGTGLGTTNISVHALAGAGSISATRAIGGYVIGSSTPMPQGSIAGFSTAWATLNTVIRTP
jgi:hypothetical protein